MPDTFGARLRQRREERRIDLNTIAKLTKIKPALLEALERDDVSQWPAGIYRRAFVRAYAHAIQLDPGTVVSEFMEVHPEPAEVDVLAAMASTLCVGDRTERTVRPSSNRVRSVVGRAIQSWSRLRRGAAFSPPLVPCPPVAPCHTSAAPLPHADVTKTTPPSPPPPAVVEQRAEVPSDRLSAARAYDVEPNAPVASSPTLSSPAVQETDELPTDRSSAAAGPGPTCEVDLLAVAQLCTDLALVESVDEAEPPLRRAATLLNAKGLVVWLWDRSAEALTPALVHGYSERMISQLPRPRSDADNATALAFRSGQVCCIPATEQVNGALVVPLLTSSGCAGVLAIELQRRGELTNAVRATATILATLLAQMTLHAVLGVPEPVAVAR